MEVFQEKKNKKRTPRDHFTGIHPTHLLWLIAQLILMSNYFWKKKKKEREKMKEGKNDLAHKLLPFRKNNLRNDNLQLETIQLKVTHTAV